MRMSGQRRGSPLLVGLSFGGGSSAEAVVHAFLERFLLLTIMLQLRT
jgi:hypothetical protein